MVGDFSKLMLRAYNAEADNCVAPDEPQRLARRRSSGDQGPRPDRRSSADDDIRITPATTPCGSRSWSSPRTTSPRTRRRRSDARSASACGRRRRHAKSARPRKASCQGAGALGAGPVQVAGRRRGRQARRGPGQAGTRSTKIAGVEATRGQHPHRLGLRHLQHRRLRLRHGQDRADPTSGTPRAGPRARRRVGAVQVRHPRPGLSVPTPSPSRTGSTGASADQAREHGEPATRVLAQHTSPSRSSSCSTSSRDRYSSSPSPPTQKSGTSRRTLGRSVNSEPLRSDRRGPVSVGQHG